MSPLVALALAVVIVSPAVVAIELAVRRATRERKRPTDAVIVYTRDSKTLRGLLAARGSDGRLVLAHAEQLVTRDWEALGQVTIPAGNISLWQADTGEHQ